MIIVAIFALTGGFAAIASALPGRAEPRPAAPAAGPAAAGAAEEEGKSTADVELTEVGASKIAVIKAVKEALALGLKEAKDLVDGAPSMLKTGMKKEDAAELAKKLTDAGAKVTLK